MAGVTCRSFVDAQGVRHDAACRWALTPEEAAEVLDLMDIWWERLEPTQAAALAKLQAIAAPVLDARRAEEEARRRSNAARLAAETRAENAAIRAGLDAVFSAAVLPDGWHSMTPEELDAAIARNVAARTP